MAINLGAGLLTTGQFPLDDKLYFLTLADMQELGSNNFKAFYYYDKMIVLCVEDGKKYIWREKRTNEPNGLLENDFLYPANAISNGIDYSGKSYNFFEYLGTVYRSNQVLRGGEISWSGSGFNHFVAALLYIIQNETYQSKGGEAIFAAADADNPRFDAIVVDREGNIIVLTGEPATIPQQQVIDNTTYCLVAYVYIPAAVLTLPGATKTVVYAENAQAPTEFNTSTGFPSEVDFASATNVNDGALCLSYKGTGTGQPERTYNFVSDTTRNVNDISVIEIYIRLEEVQVNTDFLSFRIGLDGGDMSDRLVVQNGDFGYNYSLVGEYQRIVVDVAQFLNAPLTFNKIEVLHNGGTHINYNIDDISLIGGTPSTNPLDRPYWQRIQNGDVHKLDTNLNNNAVEDGDVVRDMIFTETIGDTVIETRLPYGTYVAANGPSTQQSSYVKPASV